MASGTEPNPGQIDPRDFDIARTATAPGAHSDPMLEALIRLARDRGGPTPWIYVMLGGVVMSGRLGSDAMAAQNADEGLLAYARKVREEVGDDARAQEAWDDVIARLEEGFLGPSITQEDQRRETLLADITHEVGDRHYLLSDLPPPLARRALRDHSPNAFTLLDAYIVPSNGPTYTVGVVRVRTAEVSAWWMDPTQPDPPRPVP